MLDRPPPGRSPVWAAEGPHLSGRALAQPFLRRLWGDVYGPSLVGRLQPFLHAAACHRPGTPAAGPGAGSYAQLCRRLLWLGKSSPSEEPERLSGGGRGQLPLGGWQGVPFNPLREGEHRHAGGGWEQDSGVGGPPAPGAWLRGCGRAAGQPLPV